MMRPLGLRVPEPVQPWLLLAVGLVILTVPTFIDLWNGIWRTDDQSQGPIVLALTIWLTWRKWPALRQLPIEGTWPITSWFVLVFGGVLHAFGRSQGIYLFEVGSFIVIVCAALVLIGGTRHLRLMAFPIFFLLFLIPLPGSLVDALTQPMKMGVSWTAEKILGVLGYPIARSGVIIQIGQYQLLVADACAGLHTLFTLEALGLLYLNVVRHASLFRNVALAILIVPIGFSANVIRVMVLTLVTYHFGDAAGQGFLHGFAGFVLFLCALMLTLAADSMLRWGVSRWGKAA
jgi:exosortase B